MSPVRAQYVPQKAGTPFGRFVNRPSVEYTGRGNDLCCFAWNGRYFRSSIADVKAQCDEFVKKINGTEKDDGDYGSVGDLEAMWGLFADDSGERFGWAPSDEWAFPCFTYDICSRGTNLFDQFGEDVFLISIPPEASPYECYWEV